MPPFPPPRPARLPHPMPPPPSRDARAALRASIVPSDLSLVTSLPSFAQALEDETLRPVRPEDFYDLTDPPKQVALTPEQRRTLLRQAFFVEGLTLAELEKPRIRVAYRIVREHLRLRGVHTEEPLGSLGPTAECRDPWTFLRSEAPRHLNTSAAASAAIPLLDEADKLTPKGLPLLPPGAPSHIAPINYQPGNPEHDPRLHLFVRFVETAAEYLGIPEGSKSDPSVGRFGLLGLTNPLTIRLLFPSRLQLVQYERILMQETLEILVREGRQRAETTLHDKYGFFDDEIMLLFKLSKQRARATTHADVEEDKALMILRLEELYRTAEMSPRTQLMILKLLSVVQGLARVEPEDFHAKVEEAFKKLEEEPRKQLPELSLDDD